MKVIAINGSMRTDGNTKIMLETALGELRREGIETDLVSLAHVPLAGCVACGGCSKLKNRCCAVTTDAANEFIAKIADADGVLLGSPVYFADITASMKALIERVGYVARANDNMLRRKVGAAVIAVRRGGAIHAFNSINHFFLISEMIIPGSSYWNLGIGREAGAINDDAEGLATMRTLGANMAWLLKKTHA